MAKCIKLRAYMVRSRFLHHKSVQRQVSRAGGVALWFHIEGHAGCSSTFCVSAGRVKGQGSMAIPLEGMAQP